MSRFISDKPNRITLVNGDWVDIKKLSYAEFSAFMPKDGEMMKSMDFMKAAIVGWNFKNDDGSDVACTPDNIGNLDLPTVSELVGIVAQSYMPEKKSEVQFGTSTSQVVAQQSVGTK